MPEIAQTATQSPLQKADPSACRPVHGIPDICRKSTGIHGRSNWYRIFGLIHMLGSAEDDGPVSRIHY
jgi:hypothetical protein